MMLVGLEALKLAKMQGNTEQALREEIEILRRLLADATGRCLALGMCSPELEYLGVLDMVVER
jgi:hypothetical protein